MLGKVEICGVNTARLQVLKPVEMDMLLRRAVWQNYCTDEWYAKMQKINDCLECRQCASRCPYELDTPTLLEENLADYRRVLAGEVSV